MVLISSESSTSRAMNLSPVKEAAIVCVRCTGVVTAVKSPCATLIKYIIIIFIMLWQSRRAITTTISGNIISEEKGYKYHFQIQNAG